MTLPLILRPAARADLLAARDWYEQQRPGLGETFAEAVDVIFRRIEEMPESFAATFRDVRRAKLRKFPYVVYYRVLAERIEVIAVLHGHRDPRIWQYRA